MMPPFANLPDHLRGVLEPLVLDAERRGYERGVMDGKASGQAELLAGIRAIQCVVNPQQVVATPQLPVHLSQPLPKPAEPPADGQATDGDEFDLDAILDDLFGGEWDAADVQAVLNIAIVAVREAADAQGVDPEPYVERLKALAGNKKAAERVMMGHPVWLAWMPVRIDNPRGKYQYKAVGTGEDEGKVAYGADAEKKLRKKYGGKEGADPDADTVSRENAEYAAAREKARTRVDEIVKSLDEGRMLKNAEWEEFHDQLRYLTGGQLKTIRQQMQTRLLAKVRAGKRKADRIGNLQSAIKSVVQYGVTRSFQEDYDKLAGESVADEVKKRGGLDPDSADFKRFFESADEAKQYGVATKKGGRPLDTLAESLVADGYLVVPDGQDAAQVLVYALMGKKKVAGADDRKYWEQEEARHNAQQAYDEANAEPAAEQELIGETAETPPADADTSFDFGANADEQPAVEVEQEATETPEVQADAGVPSIDGDGANAEPEVTATQSEPAPEVAPPLKSVQDVRSAIKAMSAHPDESVREAMRVAAIKIKNLPGDTKDVARQILNWSHQMRDAGNTTGADAVDSIIERIPGVSRIGAVGDVVPYDPRVHHSAKGFAPGRSATVLRHGHQIDDGTTGRPLVMMPATVRAVGGDQATDRLPDVDSSDLIDADEIPETAPRKPDPAPEAEPEPAKTPEQPTAAETPAEPEDAPAESAPRVLTPEERAKVEKLTADAMAAAKRRAPGGRLTPAQSEKIRRDTLAKFRAGLEKPAAPLAPAKPTPAEQEQADKAAEEKARAAKFQPVAGAVGTKLPGKSGRIQANDGLWYPPDQVEQVGQANEVQPTPNNITEGGDTDAKKLASVEKAIREAKANGEFDDGVAQAIAESMGMSATRVKQMHEDVVASDAEDAISELMRVGKTVGKDQYEAIAKQVGGTVSQVRAAHNAVKEQTAFNALQDLKDGSGISPAALKKVAKDTGLSLEKVQELAGKLDNASMLADPDAEPEPKAEETPAPQPAPKKAPTKRAGETAARVKSMLESWGEPDRIATSEVRRTLEGLSRQELQHVASQFGVQPGTPSSVAEAITGVKGGSRVVFDGDATKDKRNIRAVVGKDVDDDTLAALGMAGAFKGDDRPPVTVETRSDKVILSAADVDGNEASRVLFRDADGKLVLSNDTFTIEGGSGLGTAAFAEQVDAARKAGVDRITTTASRGPNLNGYYTWPRLGYDGPLPKETLDELPAKLRSQVGEAGMVSGLMATEEGRKWWKENGHDIDLAFDLSPGSRSMETLTSYIQSGQSVPATQPALKPKKSPAKGRKKVGAK